MEKHRESHPAELAKETQSDPDLIPQELLRKYIVYAKTHVRPVLDNVDQDKIARMWVLDGKVILATRSCGERASTRAESQWRCDTSRASFAWRRRTRACICGEGEKTQ